MVAHGMARRRVFGEAMTELTWPEVQNLWELEVSASHPKKRKPDAVNHPSHYTFGSIEVIDVLDDWKLSYNRSCVIKYVARAGRKDPNKELEDLRKAQWYLNREIAKLESK